MASASHELQELIRARLKAVPTVTSIVGARVFDHAPADAAMPFITLGPSDATPVDSDCILAREETLQVDIWHRDQGKLGPCRQTVDAVKAALHGWEGSLATNALVELRVRLVRVLQDPDGITAHGVVLVTATIEEE